MNLIVDYVYVSLYHAIRNSIEADTGVAGSEVGAETSLKVRSGSGVGSETN
jgi:hypothetical protein